MKELFNQDYTYVYLTNDKLTKEQLKEISMDLGLKNKEKALQFEPPILLVSLAYENIGWVDIVAELDTEENINYNELIELIITAKTDYETFEDKYTEEYEDNLTYFETKKEALVEVLDEIIKNVYSWIRKHSYAIIIEYNDCN